MIFMSEMIFLTGLIVYKLILNDPLKLFWFQDEAKNHYTFKPEYEKSI